MSRYLLPRIFSITGASSFLFKRTPNGLLTRNFANHLVKKAEANESQKISNDLSEMKFISKHYIPKEGEVLEFLNRYHIFPKPCNNAETKQIRCPNCRPKKFNH